jgi:hypothetical protein
MENPALKSQNDRIADTNLDKNLLEILTKAVELNKSGNYEQSLPYVHVVLEKAPRHPIALETAFLSYYHLTRYTEALEWLDEFTKYHGISSIERTSRAVVLLMLKRYEESREIGNEAVKLDPTNWLPWLNRGAANLASYRYQDALRDLKKAKKLDPNQPQMYSNLGNTYSDIHLFDKAAKEFSDGLVLFPQYRDLTWNQGLFLLKMGKYTEGWKGYETRPGLGSLHYKSPKWDGTTTGQTILLDTEQGIGDIIQFSRYIDLLVKKDMKVLLEIDPALVGILSNIDGITKILKKRIEGTLSFPDEERPHYDVYQSIMSLPYVFDTTLDNIPPPTQLNIKRNTETLFKWQSILGNKTRPRIGVLWSGREEYNNDKQRSMFFREFIRGLPEGPEYFCMQKFIRQRDINDFKSQNMVSYIGNNFDDYIDTAAALTSMDLLVSVDTGVAHLSATMNKETWIMISHANDWRWLTKRTDSPWYPSVKLYRQQPEDTGSWKKVLSKIRTDIKNKFNLKG